jgi:hypothetical protein
VWPVGLATDPKREERIHAFAKSNGWAATIHDLGTRVVFKKTGGVVFKLRRYLPSFTAIQMML